MKKYDLVIIGTGSAMNTVEPYLQLNPEAKIAVIDKDPPGGICLNKGCIPTKMLMYPAEIVRLLTEAKDLGVEVSIKNVDFAGIMARMHASVDSDVGDIRKNLSASANVDYYPAVAEFTGPYQLRVLDTSISSDIIFLCLGSRPRIPLIKNLEQVNYHTSDSILRLKKLPASLAIVGGSYIAAEFGHFFSAMGSRVAIIGRNKKFLPEEEPEISDLAKQKMSAHLQILTGHEVKEVKALKSGKKELLVLDKVRGKLKKLAFDEILMAAGRRSNSDLLNPERSGIETDRDGWIAVNDFLETTAANIWAFGDANGKHLFKHVANYESKVVYYNAVLNEKIKMDYHAVPHAVFSYPEVAAVGLTEKKAGESVGKDNILVGFHRYQDTAKGEAMGVKDYFVKVIVEYNSGRILGAHIIGPQASVLIQEIVTLMYSQDRSVTPITAGMHIHPALSEVVERACAELMPAEQYHHLLDNGML
jgi:mycothione reductase